MESRGFGESDACSSDSFTTQDCILGVTRPSERDSERRVRLAGGEHVQESLIDRRRRGGGDRKRDGLG